MINNIIEAQINFSRRGYLISKFVHYIQNVFG